MLCAGQTYHPRFDTATNYWDKIAAGCTTVLLLDTIVSCTTYDTIPAILLISDTAEHNNHHFHTVYWTEGYVLMTTAYYPENYYDTENCLAADKKRLPPNIIVWDYRIIK